MSVYGIAQDGVETLLGSGDDSALSGFWFEQQHVIGQMAVSGSTPNVGGSHNHRARGVLLGSGAGITINAYFGLQLRVRGEYGTDSQNGLQIHSVELEF